MVVVTENATELGALIESVRHSLYRFETWTVSIRELYKTDLNEWFEPGFYGPRTQRDDLYSEVLRLLDKLQIFLGDLMPILNGTRKQRKWVKSSINTPPDDIDISSSEDSDSEFADYIKKNQLETADSETVTESNELCQCIRDTITSLMTIAMQVDDSVLHSKFDFCRLKNADSVELDIMHVREKFPLLDCNHPLARKLGKANAQRRKWLESRRQDYFYDSPFQIYRYDSNLCAQTTGASYGNNNLSSSARATVNPNEVGHSGMNQEDAETTMATVTDFGGSSTVEIDEDELESLVPEPNSELTPEKRFQCPYCYIQVQISNTTEWQRHVFADLSSYVCTFDSCPAPLFETREQWFQHEMEVHRKNWRCDMCDEIQYTSWNMKRHLTQKHSKIIKAENVEAHTQRLGRPLETIGAEACPLCDYKGTLQRRSGSKPSDWELTPQAFGNHLAKHLEELSLLVLPPTTANERKGKATARLTDFNPSGTGMNSIAGNVQAKSNTRRTITPLRIYEGRISSSSVLSMLTALITVA
ncbi:hypothetical protein QBC32DRAFT_370460 [Pseudoneurospora amorphoporcata]|uniref:Oxidoreductase acuF-like C2H2 type zinc-finger domain-containing protein n=1 Tax=Pseudoneurospora amorphoporcata TaxID=241081 RepID=A0AAN6NWA9_9PEZI|nr:hypothetical protein QBC32DRAFT_370460 [Pseudoneurospora amorphoporcata]